MQTNNPLKPGYKFDAQLVAGLTPIIKGEDLDCIIDRPNGMKGFVINITSQGEGTIFHGDGKFYVKTGDLLLFPPKTTHLYCRRRDSMSWLHRWVYFRPRAFWKDWLCWYKKVSNIYLTRALDEGTTSQIEHLFVDIETALKSEKPYSEDLATSLLEQLLLRCKAIQPDTARKPLDPRVVEAMNFMTQNLNQKFTLEDVASFAYLSPSRLSHLFKKEVGMTVKQWRDDQRIMLAKQLLLTSHYSINHIGRTIGFSDPLYFSRVFRRKTGTNPTGFRGGGS